MLQIIKVIGSIFLKEPKYPRSRFSEGRQVFHSWGKMNLFFSSKRTAGGFQSERHIPPGNCRWTAIPIVRQVLWLEVSHTQPPGEVPPGEGVVFASPLQWQRQIKLHQEVKIPWGCWAPPALQRGRKPFFHPPPPALSAGPAAVTISAQKLARWAPLCADGPWGRHTPPFADDTDWARLQAPVYFYRSAEEGRSANTRSTEPHGCEGVNVND